ncbi:aminoacyl-tRNA hydrolase [Candidatus Latescibacterota bacterium]
MRRNELLLTVVGLGNPGATYKKSRHNAGYMLIDGIADGHFLENVTFQQKRRFNILRMLGLKGKLGTSSGPYAGIEGKTGGKRFLLVKPATYMNESGKTLAFLKRRGKIKDLSEVLVVVDDVDLELGRIRLRADGSAGGHNGLKSIISYLGTEEFSRLKIGVGPRPDGADLVEYVLGSFVPEEFELLNKSLKAASTVVEAFILEGFDSAQSVIARL